MGRVRRGMTRGLTTAALGVLAAIVVSCGGDAKQNDTTTPRDSSRAAASAAPAKDGAAIGRIAVGRGGIQVLFIGTSLTAGLGLDPDSAFPALIERKADSINLRIQATNAGLSGETSAGLVRRIQWLLTGPGQLFVIESGANDGLRGQSVEATKATIGEILMRIKKERPEARVVLVQMEAPTNLGTVYTRAFHAMFPALAREHDVTLMPFLLAGVAGEATLNQGDGVHPNLAGERIVTETVWRALRPLLR